MADGFLPPLREAVNVDDLKKRDRLVRRLRKIRADAVLDKNTLLHINTIHPDWPPFDTAFEDAVIAYCDGKGPMPEKCAQCAMDGVSSSFIINGSCTNPKCRRHTA